MRSRIVTCILLAFMAFPAVAQVVPEGVWIDRSTVNGERYCVTQTAMFNRISPTLQTFIWCSPGWGVGGHAVVQITGGLAGTEIPLYRLEDVGGYLEPRILTSVATVSIDGAFWVLRFGSPGAQTPTYTLTRQPLAVQSLDGPLWDEGK